MTDQQGGDENAQAEKIAELLALFDGNKAAAQQAVRLYRAEPRAKSVSRELSTEVIVRITDLTKTYKIGRQTIEALSGVSLDIHRGEFLALTGASGSGKSTLLQLIGGLDKPTSGGVTIHDKSLAAMRDGQLSRFRNRTIGFVFQFFYLQPFLRLGQNLEVAGMPAGTPRVERRERVRELAELVGLADRIDHLPRELSGGQMQRAAIARALLNRPEIILADEPTGNLDSKNGRAIIDLFERIRDELGTTVIVVTHDAEVAARADREIHLKDGVIT